MERSFKNKQKEFEYHGARNLEAMIKKRMMEVLIQKKLLKK